MELGWIDFSKTERSKILSVLDFLGEKGVLDELGISPICFFWERLQFKKSQILFHSPLYLIDVNDRDN